MRPGFLLHYWRSFPNCTVLTFNFFFLLQYFEVSLFKKTFSGNFGFNLMLFLQEKGPIPISVISDCLVGSPEINDGVFRLRGSANIIHNEGYCFGEEGLGRRRGLLEKVHDSKIYDGILDGNSKYNY